MEAAKIHDEDLVYARLCTLIFRLFCVRFSQFLRPLRRGPGGSGQHGGFAALVLRPGGPPPRRPQKLEKEEERCQATSSHFADMRMDAAATAPLARWRRRRVRPRIRKAV